MERLSVPMLVTTHTVVLGGNTAGLACALQHAAEGKPILLMEAGTCLYREMHRTGCYALPPLAHQPGLAALFPTDCRVGEEQAHPDRLKQWGEALCAQAGIQLLYATQAVDWQDGRLLVAHKSGLYGIACRRIFDCRGFDGFNEAGPQSYCLHVMNAPDVLPDAFRIQEALCFGDWAVPAGDLRFSAGAGIPGHALLHIPLQGPGGDTPQSRHAVYQLALAAFAVARRLPGLEMLTLARSGSACGPAGGFNLAVSMAQGLACREGWSAVETAGFPWPPLRHLNPLYPRREAKLFLPPAASAWQGDVIVVGGGTSGGVAAWSAARQGLKVLVVEMNRRLGGTGTCGGVSTYWFGTRDGATALIDAQVDALYSQLGLPRDRCRRNPQDGFLPDLKAHALLALGIEAGVAFATEAVACAAVAEGGGVRGVAYVRAGRLHLATAGLVIDATGDADVAMLAGAAHSYGGERGALTYWASLAQYTTPSAYRNNFSTMVHVGCPLDYTRFIVEGRLRGGALYDHGDYVALRESRHIHALRNVTLDMLLRQSTPPDTLYQCFSNYDPKGRLTGDIIYAGLLPPNLLMNVPLGAVIPLDDQARPIPGLLVGGKAIGCSHDALPGLRMQPDLQQQGFALGVLAAMALRQGVPPWQVRGVAEGVTAAGGQRIQPLTGQSLEPRDAVAALTGHETLEWLDMDRDQAVTQPSPVIACFLAPSEGMVPVLKKACAAESPDTPRALLLARLLLWHRCDDGTAQVLAHLRALLKTTEGLPTRLGPITFGQLLPDHGLMPETVYLLNTLAWSQAPEVPELFAQVLRRLLAIQRDWRDLRAGIYCYVESFAYVAARRGDPAFLPMLKALLSLPELAGKGDQDPLLAERYQLLRLTMAEAVWRLGDGDGLGMLRALACASASCAIRVSAQAILEDPRCFQPFVMLY